MLRGLKVEILPTSEQALKIRKTIGIYRYLYNLYLASNFEVYETLGKGFFITGYTFDKYVNHVVKKEYEWIDECGAKARKQALMNAERAFKNYMKGKTNRPKFKKKRQQKVKAYFPKNAKGDWTIWRHKIQIPTIGVVKLKEKGYLPTNDAKVRSGTISYKAGRYYVSVLVEIANNVAKKPQSEGIGIDLGVKELAIMSNGVVKPNINKTPKVIKLNRKLRREQRRLSRKYETKKKRGEKTAAKSANIEKQVVKIQRIYQTLTNIRVDYENKIISEIVKREPSFIVLEDLNVRGLMKNRHLSKAIAAQRLSYFRIKLTIKAKEYGIEVRIVDRYYPSSKKCSQCGRIKKDLKLKDRVYRCECGFEKDRDLNAAINLKNATEYKTV